MKIKPIEIPPAASVKQISKNISAVLEFQITLAAEMNRVIEELSSVKKCEPVESINIDEFKELAALNKAEIKSYRNILGSQLDEMRRELDKIKDGK